MDVAVLEPFLVACIHTDPVSSLAFIADAIVTTDRTGVIKVWKRP